MSNVLYDQLVERMRAGESEASARAALGLPPPTVAAPAAPEVPLTGNEGIDAHIQRGLELQAEAEAVEQIAPLLKRSIAAEAGLSEIELAGLTDADLLAIARSTEQQSDSLAENAAAAGAKVKPWSYDEGIAKTIAHNESRYGAKKTENES